MSSNTGDLMLRMRDVVKEFASPEGADPLHVLRGVSIEVGAGESVAITGPSGSGKSTLLNLAGLLDDPTSGSVELDGRGVAELPEKQRAILRNRRVGFVFQLHHLLPQCTALENVLVPVLARRSERGAMAEAEARAAKLLERVGLGNRMAHRPSELSGGERQRVALVRALINRPGLLLADEPTGSLDRHASETLMDLLLEVALEQGVALVMVTHSGRAAARMARIFELRDGRLCE
jgi:lipoprotein-releasing system ATP-binding protein